MTALRDVRFRAHDGAPLSARVGGERGAFPLLFVHGWLADSRVWNPVVEDLGRDFRVVCIDLRGAGESRRATGPCSLEAYAADCRALVSAVGLDPALVIGHSLGAAIAQRFAVDEPEAVEALALVNPTPPSGARFEPQVDAMFRGLPGDRDRLLAWIRRLTAAPLDPETERDLLRAALAIDRAAALEAYEAWSGADFAAEAATIEQPVLVLAGERDRAFPPATIAREIASPLANATFEVLEGAGHYLPLERASEVAERLRAFVDRL